MSLLAGNSTGSVTGNSAGNSAGNLSGDTTGPGWIRRLWAYIARHRRELYLSLTGALIGGACQVVIPLAERQIVDGVVVSHTSALWPWLLLMALLSLLGFAMSYLRRYNGGRVALGVQFDLRNAMHDHLQQMDAQTLDAMPTGQLVGRASSDSTLVQGLLNYIPVMSSNVLLVIGSLAVMLWLSPLLAVVGLVVVPVVTVLSYRMRSRVFPASWDAQQREGDVVQMVDECLNGVRVVKAFGQEQRELRRVTEASKVLYGSQVRQVRFQARYQPILQAMPALGQVAVLALGGWMALHHQISLGTFLAFSTYMAQLVAPAQRLANVITVAQQARAGVERIFQLLDLRPAIADRPGATDLRAGPRRGHVRRRPLRLRRGRAGPGRIRPDRAGRRAGRPDRTQRVRQVHGRAAAVPVPRPAVRRGAGGRPGRARRDAGLAAPAGRDGVRGQLPVLRIGAGQHRLRAARGLVRPDRGGGPGRGRA